MPSKIWILGALGLVSVLSPLAYGQGGSPETSTLVASPAAERTGGSLALRDGSARGSAALPGEAGIRLASRGQGSSASGPSGRSGKPAAKLPLEGIWHVKTDDLGVFVPYYGTEKSLGFVTWKLIYSGTELVVLEFSPGSDSQWRVISSDPERFPYKKMKVRRFKADPDGRWVTFRIDRSVGAFDAYEAFELNRFSKDEILGEYRIHDRYGSGPGTGGEFSGSIRLVRYEKDP